MSFSLFASVVCTALSSAAPLELPAEAQDGVVAAQVGVHVTPTRLVARNYSSTPQLFVFRDAETDRRALRTLQPGATIAYDYARETLDDVRLEVIAQIGGEWSWTGSLDLSGALVLGEETLWIQSRPGHAAVWMQTGEEEPVLTSVTSDESVIPEEQRRESIDASMPACAPAHVPVVNPGPRPKGDAPPKLERRPLPPV